MNKILNDYYINETILNKININNSILEIEIELLFCEWQLEELKEKNDKTKGIRLLFSGVSNVFNELLNTDEFVLDLIIDEKQKNVKLLLDDEDVTSLTFYYKDLDIVKIF